MAQQVTITSVTANTPVDIYYCNSTSGDCISVATVSVFPYTFDVPDPYDYEDFVIKIIDTQGCIDGDIIYITPTPTPNVTPSLSFTPTQTITQTITQTKTPTQTPTFTMTPTQTQTQTQSPSLTPAVSYHSVGQNLNTFSANSCYDVITTTNYYTYIADANLLPIVGVKIYTTLLNGTLYNPFNGQNRWLKMGWGTDYYAVLIDTSGNILNFVICS
jgi:hypothetical protein